MKKLPLWAKILIMILGGPFTVYAVCFSILFDVCNDMIDTVEEKIDA